MEATRDFGSNQNENRWDPPLQQVLDTMSDGVLTVDRNWIITCSNSLGRRMLTAPGDCMGKSFWQVFPVTIYADTTGSDCYRTAMEEAKPCDFEAFYPEPLNRWIHVSARPAPNGIILFFRDTTEERRAVAALIQSEKLNAISRLVSTLAQEINTPLQSLTNLLYLARERCADPCVREYLDPTDLEIQRIFQATTQTLRSRDLIGIGSLESGGSV